jgi:hypothetical protein
MSVHVRFVVDKVALRHVSAPSTSVFRCQYHPTNAPYSSSSTLRASTENLGKKKKKTALSETGDDSIYKLLLTFSLDL